MFSTETIITLSAVALLLIFSIAFVVANRSRKRRRQARKAGLARTLSTATEDSDEFPFVELPESTLNSLENLEISSEAEVRNSPAEMPVDLERESIQTPPVEWMETNATFPIPPIAESIGDHPIAESVSPLHSEMEDEVAVFTDSEPEIEEEPKIEEPHAESPSQFEPAPVEGSIDTGDEEIASDEIEESAPELIEAFQNEEIAPLPEIEQSEEVAAIASEAKAIHQEIEAVTAEVESTPSEDELKRATLRPAPKRKRQERIADAALDKEISELDHRLDALEALVASIEESLADFGPLLEEDYMDTDPSEGDSPDDHARAA